VPARRSAARVRHRELYDDAYADQMFRNATLRREIRARLAIQASSPADDAAPGTECNE
jgi:hypothetical protein